MSTRKDDKPMSREWLRGRNGITSNAWKGERAGYHAIHQWLTKHFSKGDCCEECGTKEFSRLEWANISGQYKRERTDYRVLCPRCHRLMDVGNTCRRGHEYSEENTRINKVGHRVCRSCQALNQRKYMEKQRATTNKV